MNQAAAQIAGLPANVKADGFYHGAKKAGAVAQPTPRWRDFCFRPAVMGRHEWKNRVTSRVTAPMKPNKRAGATGLNAEYFADSGEGNVPKHPTVVGVSASRNAARVLRRPLQAHLPR